MIERIRLGVADCHGLKAAYSSYEWDSDQLRLCLDCTKKHHATLIAGGWYRASVDLDVLVNTPKEA